MIESGGRTILVATVRTIEPSFHEVPPTLISGEENLEKGNFGLIKGIIANFDRQRVLCTIT